MAPQPNHRLWPLGTDQDGSYDRWILPPLPANLGGDGQAISDAVARETGMLGSSWVRESSPEETLCSFLAQQRPRRRGPWPNGGRQVADAMLLFLGG